ncbi:Cdc42 like protein [Tritrichomonas foetus]|uniref:Cdc42 like protein n=1 Tax=Tritrichomonas foetus TaxID=1144522 RepID=A0A1J4K486_9EUKA|nr:Cdc42 like protein [Tritrichomonas foetus]|eukprot:OHT04309.1 Cdc42 like protein [Tritrichomonas foetus]
MSNNQNSLKLVIVGDGAVGKTCLLVVYAKGEFPTDYVPTVFENYKAKVKINNVEHTVLLWDTAGQEELLNIRVLSYANTDVFLMCFSVVDRATYENVKEKWIPEVIANTKGKKPPVFIIVGTKTDLRESTPQDQVLSVEDGKELASQVNAVQYVECSALKNNGVKEVFDAAFVEAINHSSKSKDESSDGCCLIA